MNPKARKADPLPWETIRQRYITEPGISLRQLAEEFETMHSWLARRARAENWKLQREQAIAELTSALRRNAAAAIRTLGPVIREHLDERLQQMRRIVGALLDEVERGIGPQIALEPQSDEITKETLVDGKTRTTVVMKRTKPKVDSRILELLLRTEMEVLTMLAEPDEEGEEGDGAGAESQAVPTTARPIQIH